MSAIETINSESASGRSHSASGFNFREGMVMLSRKVSQWTARRRTRRALLALSEHQLKDIGISRADAYREGTRSFWF